jgi:hypothetical protein
MTTECLPCQHGRLAAADADVVPETTGTQKAHWEGPIGLEGMATGDGRYIEKGALRWDSLPIPLRWVEKDVGAHDGAVVVGKVEDIERIDYDEANERLARNGKDPMPESFKDATVIWGSGSSDLGSEYGREAYRQVDEDLTPGVSMDLDDILVEEPDEPGNMSMKILEGRVRAATQVAIPAFEGARIATSQPEQFDLDLYDVDTLASDEFNWVEDVGGLPGYIKRIHKHLMEKGMDESHAIATSVNVVKKMCATGDVNFPGVQQVNAASRAQACSDVAEWEEKKARAHATAAESEDFGLTASAAPALPRREWFANPGLGEPTGLTVEDDGRVYGHIALWGTCHIASPEGHGVCTSPPSSPSNYAYFRTGLTRTDKGEVATGKITMNTLHAGQRLSSTDAIYHYEHTGLAGADVVAGEDSHGIWVAGAARPDADLVALRAAPVSGDWRKVQGRLELVGALCVNVPGFPVPRTRALVASGGIESLVASGMVMAPVRTTVDLSDEDSLLALRERFREMDRREAAAALAARVERAAAWAKVRRTREYVRGLGTLAYNPDQWRVPKGNPDAGQWVDMPDSGVKDLESALMSAFDSASVDSDKASAIGSSVEDAVTAAEDASDSLRGGDGNAAKAAANAADEALSKTEAQLQDLADSGALDEKTASDIGAKLDSARGAVDTVKNSDLSLLGQGDIGGPGGDLPGADAEGPAGKDAGDVGGGDKGVVGDAPKGTGEDENQYDMGVGEVEGGLQTLIDDDLSPSVDPQPFEDILADVSNERALGPEGGKTSDQVRQEAVSRLKNAAGYLTNPKDREAAQGLIDALEHGISGGDAPKTPDSGPGLADALGKAGLDPAVADHVVKTGWVQDPNEMAGDSQNHDDQAQAVLNALPEGTEVVTGQEPLNVNFVKDSSAEGGWRITEIGPGLDENTFPYKVGDGLDDPETMLGGGDNDIYVKGVGDAPAEAAPGGGGAADAGKAPDGVSQAEWESMSPEERKAASSAISKGTPASRAVADARGQGGGLPPAAGESPPSRPGPPPVDANPPGEGSQQQRLARQSSDTASKLEQTLMDATEGEVDPTTSDKIGQDLGNFRDALDALTSGVDEGNYDKRDLDSAKSGLTNLEGTLMAAADNGEFSDEAANAVGTALDDMFNHLGALEQSLQGSTEPPPFATRMYVRQWLGRRGLRTGRFARRASAAAGV